jgi:hypothetical protein
VGSLVFNEAAFNFLLENPDGPMGRKLERIADFIAYNYDAAIGDVWQDQPAEISPEAGYEISVGDDGLQAVIGIVDPQRQRTDGRPTASDYMANKFQNLESGKFKTRIMDNWKGVA